MSIDKHQVEEFYKAILSLTSVKECESFFADLCTYKELEQMTQRIIAAKLLLKGDTYEEVIKKTDISSATLSRVSKCVKYGEGYKTVLKDEQN